MFEGSCHCGVIKIQFDTKKQPQDLPVRVCGCTFCIKHNPRYTTDPEGHLAIRVKEERLIQRYRFGLALADFIICRNCGVFVTACEPNEQHRGVVNIRSLARYAEFTAQPTEFTAYDSEDVVTRTARRARNWIPASLMIDSLET